MCREVLVSEPFNFKPKSPERGKVWEATAQRLNAIDQSCPSQVLSLDYKASPKLEGPGESIRNSCGNIRTGYEILEREKDGKAKIESQDLDKNKKAENKKAGKEKATAEEARKQAMERMADIKKRENDESDSGNGRKKVRRSTSDTIDFLTEKSAKDHDLKEKEIELR